MDTKYQLSFDPYEFEEKTIENVPVYYKKLPWANCIFVRLVFKHGAFSDPVGKEGLSHFLEHMMFNGSEGFENKKEIKKWSKENTLNTFNAWTSNYQTAYTLKCLPENFTKVMNDFKQILWKPHLKEEDFIKEKKVIIEEAWGRYKNEKYLKYLKEISKIEMPDHQSSRLIRPLGLPETISNINIDDIKEWYQNMYKKGNFFLVLTGKVEDSDINLLSNFLKDLPEDKFDEYKKEKVPTPAENKIIKNSNDIGDPKKQTLVSKSIIREKINRENLSGHLFVDTFYDLLHERLRLDNDLCYSLSLNIENYIDYAGLYFSVKTDNKNIDLVEKEFENVLNEIIEGKHKERFEIIKKIRKERLISAEVLSIDIADIAIWEIYMYGKVKSLKDIIKYNDKVEYEDIINFIKETFVPKQIFTEIILSNEV